MESIKNEMSMVNQDQVGISKTEVLRQGNYTADQQINLRFKQKNAYLDTKSLEVMFNVTRTGVASNTSFVLKP